MRRVKKLIIVTLLIALSCSVYRDVTFEKLDAEKTPTTQEESYR